MLPAVLSHIPHVLIWTGFCLLTPVVLWLVIWLLDDGRGPSNEITHESGSDDEPQEPDGLLAAA